MAFYDIKWILFTICVVISPSKINCMNVNVEEESNIWFTVYNEINGFRRIVGATTCYEMIDTEALPNAEMYTNVPGRSLDIQIFYIHDTNFGHYFCVQFDSNYEKVYIYNSLYDDSDRMNYLDECISSMLKKLYPTQQRYVFVKPKTGNYDEKLSGEFAIAYATTLILKENPATYGLKPSTLKSHIDQMIRTQTLSLFPRSDRKDVSQLLNEINPKVESELKIANHLFSLFTINHFVNLVVATTNYDMQYTNFGLYPELYPKCDENKNDVQILHSVSYDRIGHFICIFYDSNMKKVFIYDSDSIELSPTEIELIEKRYPNKEILHVTTMKQNDNSSCGPFAIAHATHLILEGFPVENLKFKMSSTNDKSAFMREHIWKMFHKKKLSPFDLDE